MDMQETGKRIAEAGIMPIVTVRDVADGLELVDRLVQAGTTAVEILFRTSHAPEVLREAKARHPSCLFAAGTIMDAESLGRARDAGADCLVSPGLTPQLAEIVSQSGLPLVPGVQTASEVMFAREAGYRLLKFYPAEAANALEVLADFANIFRDTTFMATGKISSAVLSNYARLPNVCAVGGSWMLKSDYAGTLADEIRLFGRGHEAA